MTKIVIKKSSRSEYYSLLQVDTPIQGETVLDVSEDELEEIIRIQVEAERLQKYLKEKYDKPRFS